LSFTIDDYDFEFPESLIANFPANPKDSARLLVYDRKTDTITHSTFKHILDFIPEDVDVVLNNTKVIKARLFGTKSSGGKIELLLQKPLDRYTILVSIRGRVKEGSELFFEDALKAKIIKLNSDGTREVTFYNKEEKLSFETLLPFLENQGHTPLPPYIKREDNKDDEKLYQPLFAKHEGAVAAPTASLHFTDTLFNELEKRHNTHYLTLHVGLGTFKPVEVEDIREHPMHSEYYEIPPETKTLIESNKPLLAIGTTVTRTIEHYVRTKEISGECNLFLHPDNKPMRVNHLLTNFHLPKSTLVMLVSSFVGVDTMKRIYAEAIKEKYRFFSYGDTMLIL
jgi:S-adenosylmethionine:tRNA ribosyltransferase-isomerase